MENSQGCGWYFTAVLLFTMAFHGECFGEDGEGDFFALLQTQTAQSPFDVNAVAQGQRLQAAKPLAWIHVPKTGSSLGNIIIHTPTVCPGVPAGFIINQTSCPTPGPLADGMLAKFKKKFPIKTACLGSLEKWGAHVGIGQTFKTIYKGHGLIMLRQPEERIVSGFNHGHHGWLSGIFLRPPQNITEYATYMQGCSVQMLTKYGKFVCGNPFIQVDYRAVEVAKLRLRMLAFVGLTSEWELSACLWRAKFGGHCFNSDFTNIRPFENPVDRPRTPATIEDLHGFTDPYDGALYIEAQKIFQQELENYGLSRTTCEPCFREAREQYANF